MEIKLISREQFDSITRIQQTHEVLTLENKGYETITKELTSEERNAMNQVSEILSAHITGFRKFSNFRTRAGRIQIRIQYNWSESFTGVGYIMLDELLNGFS